MIKKIAQKSFVKSLKYKDIYFKKEKTRTRTRFKNSYK